MPVVWLKLPNSQKITHGRPQCCPHCGSDILQRWGRVSKPIRDAKESLETIYRYRCVICERTFRHYPDGIDRSNWSERVRQVAGLAWAMGMSTREVVNAFEKVGLNLSRTSVWREGKKLTQAMDNLKESNGKKYSIDRTYIHRVSTKIGVVVALYVAGGNFVVLGTLDEYNPRVVKTWLESLIKGIDIKVSVLGTGTLDGYRSTKMGISLPTPL